MYMGAPPLNHTNPTTTHPKPTHPSPPFPRGLAGKGQETANTAIIPRSSGPG